MKLFQSLLILTAMAACNTASTNKPNNSTQHKADTPQAAKGNAMTQLSDSVKKVDMDTSKSTNNHNTNMGGGKSIGPSDIKIKNNIILLNSDGPVLPRLLKLDAVSFTYKTEYSGILGLPSGTQFGYIAQNVETLFPELVSNAHQPANKSGASELEKNGFDYKAVNYVQMIPVLTQALKEQQAEIEMLKAEIALLKEKKIN